MTLRLKMLLGGIIAVVGPFLIAGIITYIKLSASLESEARNNINHIAEDLSGLIQSHLSQELGLIKALAVDPQVVEAASSGHYAITDKKLREIHKELLSNHSAFFISDRNGILRSDSIGNIGIDISGREHFIKAKAGIPNISIPVVSSPTGSPIIFICAPVYAAGGVFSGVMASALKTDILRELILSKETGETGYSFIVDVNGRVLLHPINRHILKNNLHEEKATREIVRSVRHRSDKSQIYSFRGVDKIAGFAPIELTGWSIIVTQDRDEIMAPVYEIYTFFIWSCLIILAITLTCVVIISQKISSPVQKAIDMLRHVTQNLSEIVLYIGPDKRIEFVNPAMENLMKCPAGKIIGTKPILKNMSNIPEEEIWRTLDEGKSWSGRVLYTEDIIQPLTLEILIIPIRNARGVINNYVEIGKDITNDLTIEKRLRQAQKIEAIGTLAGGVAHDFNNVLSGIFGYAELLQYCLNGPDTAKGYIQGIINAAERARELVSQILTFSRHAELEMKQIAPREIIKEALKLLRASIPATIELRTSINSDSLILGEPTQVHQVLVNLCTNAAYAMKDDKGIIDVVLEDVDVDEEYARLHPGLRPGRHLLFRVSDTGRGIEPEHIDHIFDPFFTTKPTGEGTGLGLSVVHGIVKKLNGVISVYSEIDKGTTFNIIVPVIAPELRETDRKAGEALPGGSERILLADDEISIIDSLKTILTDLGYTISAFTESPAALEAFRSDPGGYDLVITDYTMPSLTGIEIAAALKEIRKDIPIILFSGYVHSAMEEASRAVGVSELLRKPIRTYELAAAIRRVLEGN